MKNDLLPILRKELENSFGRKIVSSRDCLQMVDDIYQKTGYTINANTLRRFFGLVQTSYSASPSTLNIFSRYCGFNSIDELENLSVARPGEDSVHEEEVIHYLVSLFKNFPVQDIYHPVMNTVVHQTVHFLNRNKSLVERFQREIAALPAGQYFYYEKGVNMDKLNGYYGDGLRFYLRIKNNNEAKVFNYSLQVFRYWLSEDADMIEKNMAALLSVPISITYPSHVLARYIAARLYYANFKGEIPDRMLADAAKYHPVINSKSEKPDPEFDLVIAEALILTGHFSEGNEFLKRGKSIQFSTKNMAYEQLFLFWEKIAGTRKAAATKIITNPVKASRTNQLIYSPLNKKYFKLISLMADGRSRRNDIGELARETGFTRLSN